MIWVVAAARPSSVPSLHRLVQYFSNWLGTVIGRVTLVLDAFCFSSFSFSRADSPALLGARRLLSKIVRRR